MSKQYNSFEEIDAQLHVLNIHRKIAVESLKLKVNRTKFNLQPSHLVGNIGGNFQKILLVFAIKKMTAFFRRKRQDNYSD